MNMKLKILSTVLLLSLAIPALAQLQIRTRGDKISDFRTRVTKVVLTGDETLDASIREAVKSFWTITPYEICTEEEFKSLKTDETLYFLAVSPDGDGLRHWFLVKGGGSAKAKVPSMVTVVSAPICAADTLSGREPQLLQALAVALQKAVDNDFKGIDNIASSPQKAALIPIILAEEEINPSVDEVIRKSFGKKNMSAVPAAEADSIFSEGENAAVAFSVSPKEAAKGGSSYVYLFNASDFRLYYFKKHKIKSPSDKGITLEDLKAFAKGR